MASRTVVASAPSHHRITARFGPTWQFEADTQGQRTRSQAAQERLLFWRFAPPSKDNRQQGKNNETEDR